MERPHEWNIRWHRVERGGRTAAARRRLAALCLAACLTAGVFACTEPSDATVQASAPPVRDTPATVSPVTSPTSTPQPTPTAAVTPVATVAARTVADVDPRGLYAALGRLQFTGPTPQNASPLGRPLVLGPGHVPLIEQRHHALGAVQWMVLSSGPPFRLVMTVFPTAEDAARAFTEERAQDGGRGVEPAPEFGNSAACQVMPAPRETPTVVGVMDRGGCWVLVDTVLLWSGSLFTIDRERFIALAAAGLEHLHLAASQAR